MNKLGDLARFAYLQLESMDMDPAYPVLKERISELGPEEQHSYVFRYLMYYNLASAERSWQENRSGVVPMTLPTGTERRNLRTPSALFAHWASLLELAKDGWGWWLAQGSTDNPERDYLTIRDVRLREPWGNGRWAVYKGAEVLEKVLGYDLAATDMGNDGSSGPLSGLELVYGPRPETDVVRWADSAGWTLQAALKARTVELSIDELETVLCNWHSMCNADYYSGHDVDLQQQQILQAERISGRPLPELWRARATALPEWTLGELNGWEGVDKDRKRAYSERGQMLRRTQAWDSTTRSLSAQATGA